MTAVAGNALSFGYRFMLDPMAVYLGLNLRMTIETDLSRLVLDKTGLISAVLGVTGKTFSFSKWRMGCFLCLFGYQILMACKAEFSSICRNFEQT